MDRYSRQILFAPLGQAGQERLHAARVVVIGCGALGTHSAEILARAGVGSIRLVDRDTVEWTNLHRQGGFEEVHARERAAKAEALAGWLRRINSAIAVEACVADYRFVNALELAQHASILVDGTDNLPTRFLLNDVSWKLGLPWGYAGAVGSSAHVQFFAGTAGPCLRCQLPELPPPGAIATCDTAGVIGPAAAVAASWQAALVLRYLSQGNAAGLAGSKALLDPWNQTARVVAVERDPRCAVCVEGRFESLAGTGAERATVLCGRAAVQVLPASASGKLIDLAALASRLAVVGQVENRGRLLRVQSTDGFTLTLFEDGRAIFDGLTDPERARTLYARFIGQ